MSDAFLDQLKNKNEAAFRQLVEDYQKLVFKTCHGILHHKDDADDVTQEVFIEAFSSIEKFRADSKLSTWLYRIAVNKSLNYLRANKRKKLLQSLSGTTNLEIIDESSQSEQPHEAYLAKQRKQIMDDAINSLPKNQKVVFVLSKIDELSYKEIAEVMEVSVSSVESLLFRARKNLQKKLLSCYKKSC